MSFFSLFRKQEQQSAENEERHEVSLDDAASWLRKAKHAELQELYSDAADAAEKVASGFLSLGGSAEKLGKRHFQGSGRESSAVNMVKGSFVSRVSSMRFDGTLPGKPAYSEVMAFHSMASALLPGLMTPKQAYVMSNYFPDESAGIVDSVKAIQSGLDMLAGMKNLQMLQKMEELESIISGIGERGKAMEAIKAQMLESGQELARLEESLASLDAKIAQAERSEEMSSYFALMDRLAGKQAEMEAIKSEISALVPAKSLRKLQYNAEKNSKMPAKELAALGDLIADPLCLLSGSHDAQYIASALSKAMEHVPGSDGDRVHEAIGNLKTKAPTLLVEWKAVEKEVADMKASLDIGIAASVKGMKEERKRMEDEISKTREHGKRLDAKTAELEGYISSSVSSIKALLRSSFGKEVTIKGYGDNGDR